MFGFSREIKYKEERLKRPPFVDWFDGHPVIAAIVAFLVPGVPQFLMGDILLGLIFFVLGFSRIVFAPALIVGVVAAIHAYWLAGHAYEGETE